LKVIINDELGSTAKERDVIFSFRILLEELRISALKRTVSGHEFEPCISRNKLCEYETYSSTL